MFWRLRSTRFTPCVGSLSTLWLQRSSGATSRPRYARVPANFACNGRWCRPRTHPVAARPSTVALQIQFTNNDGDSLVIPMQMVPEGEKLELLTKINRLIDAAPRLSSISFPTPRVDVL